MATQQTEAIGKPIEKVLAEANALAFEQKYDENPLTPLDDDSLKALAKRKLVRLVEVSTDPKMLLPALKELLDRVEGKSVERSVQDVNVKAAVAVVNLDNSDERILEQIEHMIAKRNG